MLPPRVWRRLLAPFFVAVELVLVLVFAAVAVVGVIGIPADRRRRVLGAGVFGVVYFVVEILALMACLGAWLTRPAHSPTWWQDYHYRVLRWVLGTLVGVSGWCFGFKVHVEDNPEPGPLDDEAPVLVLARHGGMGDSFTLVWLLLNRYHRRVRIVLKESLQWEPLLDVVLNRVGSCFLPAATGRDHDLARHLGTVCAGLGPGDALLLFPEGGNWTPGRRERAIRRLRRDRKEAVARAATLMSHVLPPRPGGVLACFEARPGLAVVVVAHTGLDKLTTAGEIWNAIPFQRPMTIRWWPAPRPPDGVEARLQWLTTEWAVVDEWIDARSATTP